jgi:hypothetical protein
VLKVELVANSMVAPFNTLIWPIVDPPVCPVVVPVSLIAPLVILKPLVVNPAETLMV